MRAKFTQHGQHLSKPANRHRHKRNRVQMGKNSEEGFHNPTLFGPFCQTLLVERRGSRCDRTTPAPLFRQTLLEPAATRSRPRLTPSRLRGALSSSATSDPADRAPPVELRPLPL